MVGKEALDAKLAEAVFAMKQGEMRVAESQFGFHVLRVTAVQGGKARSLEEVRKELTAELSKQKGARKFAEAGEAFSNMVYEQPDSLKPAAEQLQAAGADHRLDRQVRAPGAGRARQPEAARGAVLLRRAEGQAEHRRGARWRPASLVAARVIEHRPEEQLKYDEVKAAVGEMLRRRAAAALAQKDGEAKLARAAEGRAMPG